MIDKQNNKFAIQDSQYEFPYHYIPQFIDVNSPSLVRALGWGLEYLCYQRHLHEKVVAMQPASVLEVGCGDGYFVGGLPDSIPTRVGCDLSARAIAFAKAFHPECRFFASDFAELDGKFDIVAVIEVLEHIPEHSIAGFIKALADRLTADGRIVVSVPTTVMPLNKKHYRHYTHDLLSSQLDAASCQLEIESYEYIYREPLWLRAFRRLTENRFFSFELKALTGIAWRAAWNRCKVANSRTGYHLIAVVRRRQL